MRALVPYAALVGLALACSPQSTDPAPDPAQSERLNLVLVSLDTCRADRLSCYGNERGLTPNIDRLAEEGVLFRDCLAQSCVTAPSHMSLFTGQYVSRHGLVRNGDAAIPSHSLASVLAEHGWRTAAFTGHGSLQEQFGHGHGFELFRSWEGEADWFQTRNLDQVVPEAVAWIDAAREPFFVLVHGYDPHCPYVPPEDERERYAGWYEGELDLAEECSPPVFKSLIQDGVIGPSEMRYISALYDAEIAHADRWVGRLLDHLDERGLLERSIVVFTSDHGESLGTKNRFGHGALFPEILQVPWILRFPGGRWSGVREEPVQLIDFLPTVLSALGVPTPPGVQGIDRMPLLQGLAPQSPDEVVRIAQAKQDVAVFFGERWKVGWRDESGEMRNRAIYDLERDPLGVENLIQDPEHKARFDDFVQRHRLWAETQAEGDRLYRGAVRPLGDDEAVQRMLEALGYGGEDG